MNYQTWTPESPRMHAASDEFTITDTLVGGTTITAISSKIYLNGTDVTATNMPAGSGSYSGNSYVTPVIKLLKGGNVYVVATVVTIDGIKVTRKVELRVQKDGDLQ